MSTGIFSRIRLSETEVVQLELHLDREQSYLTLKNGETVIENFHLLEKDYHAPQNFIDHASIIQNKIAKFGVANTLARSLVVDLVERIQRLRKS